MSQLSDVASVSRKIIKFGGIGLVILMVGRVVLGAGYSYWKSMYPDPPPPPDVKFGKLPKLLFPEKELMTVVGYRLETRTGGLPLNLPDQYKVFLMPIKKPSLLAYDSAKVLAERLDFFGEPTKLSETDYRFDALGAVESSLSMNIITGAFILDRKWQQDSGFLTATIILEENQAVERVYNTLSRLGLLSEDLQNGTFEVLPLRVENNELTDAPAIARGQFVRVNLFRAPIEETIVVSPFQERGPVSAIIAFQREDSRQLVRLDYNYFPVDLEQTASYPLIGVTEAWERMQSGGGYIASSNTSKEDEVVIRDIYLAYYDSNIPQQFMQPVYVFEGDLGFVGYVPAISDTWVE